MSDQGPPFRPVSLTPEQRRILRGSAGTRGDSQTRAGLGGTWEHEDSGADSLNEQSASFTGSSAPGPYDIAFSSFAGLRLHRAQVTFDSDSRGIRPRCYTTATQPGPGRREPAASASQLVDSI